MITSDLWYIKACNNGQYDNFEENAVIQLLFQEEPQCVHSFVGAHAEKGGTGRTVHR